MSIRDNFVANLKENINLPDDVVVANFIGHGRRSIVFDGYFCGNAVVIKVYKNEFIKKYDQRFNLDIAKYEYQRNVKLYEIPEIQKHIAQPIKYFSAESNCTQAFIQQYINGITLKELINKLGYLPNMLLEEGYKIVKYAENNGIHDLDISMENILVEKLNGQWLLKLYDFNLIPQHLNPPNIFVKFALKSGLRKKSHRDYRCLKKWTKEGKRR